MAGVAYGPGNNEIVDVVVPVPNAPSLGFVGRLLATLRNVPIQLDAELVSSSGGHAVLYIHGGGWTIPGSQVQFSQVTPWARQGNPRTPWARRRGGSLEVYRTAVSCRSRLMGRSSAGFLPTLVLLQGFPHI